MLEFLNNIMIGFFVSGDTLLLALLIRLVLETISENRECDRIEKELRKKGVFYND